MKINKILVSQPVPAVLEKSPFHELSKKLGVEVAFHPFIKVEGVSLKDYRSQRVEILDHTAVIFTSRTTVDHFFRICEEARITIPETMRYLCNSEAVALYLQKYIVYRKRKIAFANGSFSDFMELILKYRNEKFLLTLSEPHKPEIPTTMEKLKLNFNKVIFSRTVGNDVSQIRPADYDLLVFYSPSEIATLVCAFGTEGLPKIATFGEGTTRAAIESCIPVMVMAPTPEIPSMTMAIESFIRRVNDGETVVPVSLGETRESEQFIKAQEAKPNRKNRPKSPCDGVSNGVSKPNPGSPTTGEPSVAAMPPKDTRSKKIV